MTNASSFAREMAARQSIPPRLGFGIGLVKPPEEAWLCLVL